MIKTISIILFMFLGLSSAEDDFRFKNDVGLLIENNLKVPEANPTHAEESEKINAVFKSALSCHIGPQTVDTDSMRLIVFELLYENAKNLYEDEPDVRRYIIRRAMCYASLALIAEEDKAGTFMKSAKFEFCDEDLSCNIELMENEYLCILWLDLLINFESGSLTKDRLN
ncbi:MAG: hypothetical protein PF588_08035 [Candidatus Kapabacteria bacterium]|jgi:hypothetical protein|nr:hypothetical protein [Candidatus Kapabacteria bacterium]